MHSPGSAPKCLLTSVLVTAICLALLAACDKLQTPLGSQSPEPTADQKREAAQAERPKAKPNGPGVPGQSAFESIDRVLASMQWATIAFNSPPKINLKETSHIQLLLSLQKPMDELRAEITAAGDREGAKIRVSNRMEARLSAANFRITAITPEEQAVGSADTVEWKWEVNPTASGRHVLHLTLTALLNVDGAATRRTIRTFDRTIEVEVTPGQRASEFLENNWQWLWAAILVPIAGLVWKGRKKRRKR